MFILTGIPNQVSRYLEKAGYLVRDSESEYLDLYTDEEDAMSSIVGASISTGWLSVRVLARRR